MVEQQKRFCGDVEEVRAWQVRIVEEGCTHHSSTYPGGMVLVTVTAPPP